MNAYVPKHCQYKDQNKIDKSHSTKKTEKKFIIVV